MKQSLDVNALESQAHRSIGPEYGCHAIWEELNLNDFFANQGIRRNVLPLFKALVMRKLVDLGSEYYTRHYSLVSR